MRIVKPPTCPKCWARMELSMTSDAWACMAPHGTWGPVMIGCDGYMFPPKGRQTFWGEGERQYWIDERGTEHDLAFYPEATY